MLNQRSPPPIRILPVLSDENPLKKKFSTQRICWKKISHSEYLFKKESPWWHFIWICILNADFNRIYLLKRYFLHWDLNADEILTLKIHCKKYSHKENSLLLKSPKGEYIGKWILKSSVSGGHFYLLRYLNSAKFINLDF